MSFGLHESLFLDGDDAPHSPDGDPGTAPPDAVGASGSSDYTGPCPGSGQLPPEFVEFRAGPAWPRAQEEWRASFDALRAFASRHHLADEDVVLFRSRLMEDNGLYYEAYLPQLYSRGKRKLAACVDGLAQTRLPVDARCEIFRRMTEGMYLCGMRIVEDLAAAADALALLREGDLRRRARAAVRRILEQEALWTERHTPSAPGRQTHAGLEIHHVAGVIEELRLAGRDPRRDDPFSPPNGRIADLVEPLRTRLTQTLTPVRVARQLADDCLSSASSDLAVWLCGQPLDLASGMRRSDGAEGQGGDGVDEISHWARLSALVQGLESAYGPLTMEAFVRTGTDGVMALRGEATLLAAQIRRNLAGQGLSVAPHDSVLTEWDGTGGRRRLLLLDDELPLLRADAGNAAVETVPAVRHLRRLQRLNADPPADSRSHLLRAVMGNASTAEIARIHPRWLGGSADALAMAGRLGPDAFTAWCEDHWSDPLPNIAAGVILNAAESCGDAKLVERLLLQSTADRARQLWSHTTTRQHFHKHLEDQQVTLTHSYLRSFISAVPLLPPGEAWRTLAALHPRRDPRYLMLRACVTTLSDYLTAFRTVVSHRAIFDRAAGDLLLSGLPGPAHWLHVLLTHDGGHERLSIIMDTVAWLRSQDFVEGFEWTLLLGSPPRRGPQAPGDTASEAEALVPIEPLTSGMAANQGLAVAAFLRPLPKLYRMRKLGVPSLFRLLSATEDGAGPTALASALRNGATSALNAYLEVIAAIRQAHPPFPGDLAVKLLLPVALPDSDGIGPLALALRNRHLDTAAAYWKRIHSMHAQGHFSVDQTSALLRAESAGGVPALAEAFENQMPEVIDLYMGLVREAFNVQRRRLDLALDWLHLRHADGQPLWPPAGGSPLDGWAVMKRYLRGLRALVEDRILSPEQLHTLLAGRVRGAPSLLGRLMSLRDRSTLTHFLDELASWPTRQPRLHAAALAAVLDIDELRDMPVTAQPCPGLPDVLRALATACARDWIDGVELVRRLESRNAEGVPAMARLMAAGDPADLSAWLDAANAAAARGLFKSGQLAALLSTGTISTDGSRRQPLLLAAFENDRSDVIAVHAAAILRAGRDGWLKPREVRALIEPMSASDCTGAWLACERGFDRALKAGFDAALEARAGALLTDGELEVVLTAYGADESAGVDAAERAGHPSCVAVWREAVQRAREAGWLSAAPSP
ncbi:MAG: hypothetical protein EOP37_25075 [Rubrivivax sp.]|nr:MAG: hypothetical protein EOP37_25075 [Rubrivivax sp.]